MIFKNFLILLQLLFSVSGSTITKTEDVCDGETGQVLYEFRQVMKNTNITGTNIHAYIIPMNDAHQSEYISDHDKRLQFITKFTGSAGTAVITQTKAALWTDSRYFIQAEKQIDTNCWLLMREGMQDVPIIDKWLIENLSIKSNVGVDPFIISSNRYKTLSDELGKNDIKLVSIKQNLIDLIWKNRPLKNDTAIEPLSIKYSGRPAGKKIFELREKLTQLNADAIIITALDEVAWLLNLRASDIPYNPLFFSYLIISKDYLLLFINRERITPTVSKHLQKEDVICLIRNYDDILNGVEELVNHTNGNIIISKIASQAIYENIPSDRLIQISSIVAKMKTIKNDIEAENLQKAHIKDGFALIRYLHWLDTVIDEQAVTEITGALKLEEFRSQQENYKGLSFETISAFGSNAAIVHYSPTDETDVQITRDEIYLIDSGGQYWEGTTDVTRTVHYGTPTEIEKECFTRVLKGFIALVTSIFPTNTSLDYFDHVARRYLWQAGLDYGHGTGHGVGAYLNVHEYPPLISSSSPKDPGALENMFTSNEPGYYREGLFGIRLEDVIQVIKANISNAFNGRGALTFKTVTLAPIQTKMINKNMLTADEKEYINNYHRNILNTIGTLLIKQNLNDTYQWLVNETNPI